MDREHALNGPQFLRFDLSFSILLFFFSFFLSLFYFSPLNHSFNSHNFNFLSQSPQNFNLFYWSNAKKVVCMCVWCADFVLIRKQSLFMLTFTEYKCNGAHNFQSKLSLCWPISPRSNYSKSKYFTRKIAFKPFFDIVS